VVSASPWLKAREIQIVQQNIYARKCIMDAELLYRPRFAPRLWPADCKLHRVVLDQPGTSMPDYCVSRYPILTCAQVLCIKRIRTNGSSLSHESAFFAIINGFALGLTKRLINTVSAMFLGKERHWSIYTFLLADKGDIYSSIP
jgi:hypothetical protein